MGRVTSTGKDQNVVDAVNTANTQKNEKAKKEAQEYVNSINRQIGTARFKLSAPTMGRDGLATYSVIDTVTGKSYTVGSIYASIEIPKIISQSKTTTTRARRTSTKFVKHDDFSEKPSPDDIAHYGILGMKWGVRRTPEQLGHDINKYERKRQKAAKKLKKVESSKGNTTYSKYNKKSYKANKKLDKAEQRLSKLMYNNSELFSQSMTALNGKQADIGRKWLTFASSNQEEQFWAQIAERMKAS